MGGLLMRWAFVIPAAILAAALGTAALARAGIGSEHSSVTLGTANGLSLSGQQLSMAAAALGQAGVVSLTTQRLGDGDKWVNGKFGINGAPDVDFHLKKTSGTGVFAMDTTGGGASSMYFFGGGSYFGYDNSFNLGTATFVGGPITAHTAWDANGVMTVSAGLKLADPGARPTCDSSTRGRIHYEAGGAGAADTVEMCGKSDADSYAWQALATF